MIFMPFNEWLQKWVDKTKMQRNFWGAMAYDLGNRLHNLGDNVLSLADISVAPALLGFKLGTAERWLFAELEMRYLDEKEAAEFIEAHKDAKGR